MNPQIARARWIVCAAVLLSASVALAAEGEFHRTLKVTGPVNLQVETGSGSIQVRNGGSSEVVVTGHIRQDAGQPVTTVKYALFLTCELVGDERIRKVRAMLVRADLLADFPYKDSMPKLENPWHADRIRTLRHAAELYAKEPDNFLVLEVCV